MVIVAPLLDAKPAVSVCISAHALPRAAVTQVGKGEQGVRSELWLPAVKLT